MRLILFGLLGLVAQGAGLAAFMVVSRTSFADLGKPAIIVFTGLVVCGLLWEGVRRSRGLLTVCLLPVSLAIGYDVAFQLLGLLGFSGLLRGSREFSVDLLWSLLQVTGTLFILFGITTVLFFAINRGFRRTRLHTNQQFPKES